MATAICEILACNLEQFYVYVGANGSEIINPNANGICRHRSFHIQEVIAFALYNHVAVVEFQTDIFLSGFSVNNKINHKQYTETSRYIGCIYTGLTKNGIPHMDLNLENLDKVESVLYCYDLN